MLLQTNNWPKSSVYTIIGNLSVYFLICHTKIDTTLRMTWGSVLHNELSKFVIFLCTLVLSLGKTHKAITISFNVILLPSVKLLHEILVNHIDHKGRVIGRTSVLVRARNLRFFLFLWRIFYGKKVKIYGARKTKAHRTQFIRWRAMYY